MSQAAARLGADVRAEDGPGQAVAQLELAAAGTRAAVSA
jgi:hypothetical protein